MTVLTFNSFRNQNKLNNVKNEIIKITQLKALRNF
mgnify:FL=1